MHLLKEIRQASLFTIETISCFFENALFVFHQLHFSCGIELARLMQMLKEHRQTTSAQQQPIVLLENAFVLAIETVGG
jgi:hypothetical protein